MDLVAFLKARLDEDEATARKILSGSHITYFARALGGQILHMVEADRRLIAEYERFEGERGYQNGLEFAIACRAAAYSDQPDYDPDWAPTPG